MSARFGRVVMGGALALVTSMGASAQAQQITIESPGMCQQVSTRVLRWTPEMGPAAAYVAGAFALLGDVWIGLGADKTGYWSAETTSNDACENHDCTELQLVHTSYLGKRRSFDVASYGTPSLEKAVKQRLFALAKKEWPVDALTHDDWVRVGKPKPEGLPDWLVEVTRKNVPTLRFGVRAVVEGCSCAYFWTGYPLAT